MSVDSKTEDVRAIENIIDRQFRSLEWSAERTGDWSAFAAGFHADASLFPSARPVKRQSVDAFVERMQDLAKTSLRSFKERMLGADIRVFGNVAVAMAGCRITENDEAEANGVEALLLVKEEGSWTIVAQAWDMESDQNTIPPDLLARQGR